MPRAVALLLIALMVLGTVPATGTTTSTDGANGDPCIDDLAFFSPYTNANPPPFRVGFSAEDGDAVFFVLETRGRVIGHTGLETFDGPLHVDGFQVPLTGNVAGVRNVTVTAYQDSNENGAFDADVDEPCTNDGQVVASSLGFFVSGDGTGVTDTTVNASPPIAHQPATWTAETTVTRAMNVTHLDIDLRQAGSVESVTPSDVRVAYSPPVNATLAVVGQPESVSVHRGGVLRLSYPDGIELQNGSRLTVHVDDVTVPPDTANVSLALTTPDAGYSATDRVDPSPIPHLEFYESFPEEGVHLRFGLPRDVSMLAVVFHDGEVVGTEYLDYDYAMTADGQPVSVQGVGGQTELTVRGYYDANGNGQYDPEVDRPFLDSTGEPIGETAVIDLPGTTTETSSPTTTSMASTAGTGGSDETQTGTTSTGVPGFGAISMLLALVGGLFLFVGE